MADLGDEATQAVFQEGKALAKEFARWINRKTSAATKAMLRDALHPKQEQPSIAKEIERGLAAVAGGNVPLSGEPTVIEDGLAVAGDEDMMTISLDLDELEGEDVSAQMDSLRQGLDAAIGEDGYSLDRLGSMVTFSCPQTAYSSAREAIAASIASLEAPQASMTRVRVKVADESESVELDRETGMQVVGADLDSLREDFEARGLHPTMALGEDGILTVEFPSKDEAGKAAEAVSERNSDAAARDVKRSKSARGTDGKRSLDATIAHAREAGKSLNEDAGIARNAPVPRPAVPVPAAREAR